MQDKPIVIKNSSTKEKPNSKQNLEKSLKRIERKSKIASKS